MDRRDFFKVAVAGTAATVVGAPQIANAAHPRMVGGVYYTKAVPGRWAKKVGGHMPLIEISRAEGEVSVKVTTPHEMKGHEHYIVKHVILNENFEFLVEKMFDPTKEFSPVSEHKLGAYEGKLNVLSVCNKHDTWLNSATI
ncbi:MAG: twin-arginine translocation signal domain-containing protein [Agarilytica sp.]